MTAFADRLIEAVRRTGSPLCVGLDPFPERIPALFGAAGSTQALRDFCESAVAVAAQHAAVLKPQLGLFEQFGIAGYIIASDLVRHAHELGLLVILDAKRGDIGSTAEGYAKASFGRERGFDADCVTVNPYMGKDTLEPFVAMAEQDERGVAVLVRTSNPGARDLQDLDVGGAPLWTRTAEMIAPLAKRLEGASGWSGLMAVAGATYPDEARRMRALLPTSLFLVPGYGAQGASAADSVAGFTKTAPGNSGVLEGGVVNSSRAVLYPESAAKAGNLAEWRDAIGAAMAAAARELRAACQA